MRYFSLRSDRWVVTFILCVGMMLHANAQTFTERVQKEVQGIGTVTIHQSSDIDQLVNDPNATGVQSSTTNNDGKQTAPSKDKGQQTSTSPAPQTVQNDDGDDDKSPTTGRKMIGYRVQAFAGGNSRKDRQMAEQARNDIKSKFPNVAVYVHFYSPRWICRVGNYRTYEEAHQMMVKLQNMGYKQASIVKGKITVAY